MRVSFHLESRNCICAILCTRLQFHTLSHTAAVGFSHRFRWFFTPFTVLCVTEFAVCVSHRLQSVWHTVAVCVSHRYSLCVTELQSVCHTVTVCVSQSCSLCVTELQSVCHTVTVCVSHRYSLCVTPFTVCVSHRCSLCVTPLRSVSVLQPLRSVSVSHRCGWCVTQLQFVSYTLAVCVSHSCSLCRRSPSDSGDQRFAFVVTPSVSVHSRYRVDDGRTTQMCSRKKYAP